MIEEELILSLPMFAYHTSCDTEKYDKADETEAALEALEEEKKPNPFEVLSDFKFKK